MHCECFNSSKFIGEVTFKKFVVYVEKIKVKVYANQGKSLSHIKIRHVYDFSLRFPHELLGSLSFAFPGTANGRFELSWQIFIKRFRFIFSFFCRKINHALQF